MQTVPQAGPTLLGFDVIWIATCLSAVATLAALLAIYAATTVRDPMAVLDAELRIERVNPAFCRVFGIEPATAVGRLVGELAGANWLRPELRRQLEQVISIDRPFEGLELSLDENVAASGMVLNARRIARAGGKPGLLLLAGNAVARGR